MIAQILIVYGSFTTGTKTFFSGGQFRPDRGGQFGPDKGGQFRPVKGGQFKPDRGGQLHRIFQFSAEKLYQELNTKNFKEYYAGKPTKRYLKITQKIWEGELVGFSDVVG